MEGPGVKQCCASFCGSDFVLLGVSFRLGELQTRCAEALTLLR